MAKNYTISEVAKIFAENKDTVALTDIGKRYPLLAIKMARLVAKDSDGVEDIFSFMPDYLSANKVNKAIKDSLEGEEEVEDEDVVETDDDEVEEAKPTKTAKKKAAGAKKKEPESDTDYDNMNNKQLYAKLGDLGKRKECKEEFGDLSKKSMLAFLKKHYGDGAEAEEVEEDSWEDEAEEVKDPYEGKTAVELFKMCKSRKIKAQAKKSAKYYVDLLKKADAAAEEESDDEDWEELEEEPAKTPKKQTKKPAKTKKNVEPEPEDDDDDDDDWDI